MEERAGNCGLAHRLLLALDGLEEVLERARDEAAELGDELSVVADAALDGEGLAGAGLAVGEDGAVVAGDARVDHGLADVQPHVLLRGVLVRHKVKVERLGRR